MSEPNPPGGADIRPFDVRDPGVTHAVIELFGGDNNLDHFVLEDLQEMAAGIDGPFAVLALADFAGSGASVFEVTRAAGTRLLESWGEIDTGDPETLARFLARSLVTYDAGAKLAIGFWDHGTGVFDEHDASEVILERRLGGVPRWRRSRSVPARRLFAPPAAANSARARAMLHDTTNGGVLTNREAGAMLRAAFERAGRAEPVDLLFSDTCLNGMVEVLEELRHAARVIVGSEDLEPGDGWDYFLWLRKMSASPPEDGAAWGRLAVEAFGESYEGIPSVHPCTLAAFRSGQEITAAFAELVARCDDQGAQGFDWLRAARDRSQAFANHDTYDILDFVDKLAQEAEAPEVLEACDRLATAFEDSRVHSVALGAEVAESHGLAFWFPNNRYAFRQVEPTYRQLRFARETGWSDYLKNQFFPPPG